MKESNNTLTAEEYLLVVWALQGLRNNVVEHNETEPDRIDTEPLDKLLIKFESIGHA